MRTLARRGEQTTLLDLLDRLLDTGVVVAGDLTISVAEVDLIFASLRLVVTSADKAWETKPDSNDGREPPGLSGGMGAEPLGPGSPTAYAYRAPEARSAWPGAARIEPHSTHTSVAPRPLHGPGATGQRPVIDPEKAANGMAQLAVTIVDLIRQLLEREVLRRMERGTLTEEEIERLGQALLLMQEKVQEIKDLFHLRDEDLNLDLGPLGKLK